MSSFFIAWGEVIADEDDGDNTDQSKTVLLMCCLSVFSVSFCRCGWRRRRSVRTGSWRVLLFFACRRSMLGPEHTTSVQTAMRSRKSGLEPWARLQRSTFSQHRGALHTCTESYWKYSTHTWAIIFSSDYLIGPVQYVQSWQYCIGSYMLYIY